MSASRWLRLNADWHLSDWLVVLSAESRLAWVQLLCHVKVNGFAGEVKSLHPAVAERLWFVNEPSIRQMLQAAEVAGAITITADTWIISKWKTYQGDETGADRQRRFKEKQKVTEGNALGNGGNGSVTEVTPTETETETMTITPKSPRGLVDLLPDHLRTEEVAKAWEDYCEHRRGLKVRQYSDKGLESLSKRLSHLSSMQICELLNEVISRNWQGIDPSMLPSSDGSKVPPRYQNQPQSKPPRLLRGAA